MSETTVELRVTMPDGSVWAVPVEAIRANWWQHYEGYSDAKLSDFDADECIDWARGDMNWSDVSAVAKCVRGASKVNYQDGWVNGPMEVLGDPRTREATDGAK